MQSLIKKGIIGILMLAVFLAPFSGGLDLNEVSATEHEERGPCIVYPSTPGEVPITYKNKTFKECEGLLGSGIRIDWEGDGGTTEVSTSQEVRDNNSGDFSFGCWPLSGPGLAGCIAYVLNIIWIVAAAIARLAGQFLDFFVYYSTNSASYDNDFVKLAWAGVRDIANIFFIIALIYVAIKTILGLNVTNNKKLISMVIVMALFINFSLFTTRVIIDGTNILAKVFYNNITPVDENGELLPPSHGGERSISVGLVDKFKIQNILTQTEYDDDKGLFIFLIVFLIAITLYAAYIFFSVALLFVARVVTLWLSMIFSPIAFVSYTLPFKIPGFGHDDWWKDLIKNALLAPIFIFFLYIIVMFASFFKDIEYGGSSDPFFVRLMSSAIPFIILAALLKEAKKITEKLAGEMGSAIRSGAAAVGGLAIGGAALGGAFLGRAAIARGTAALSRREGAVLYGNEKRAWEKKDPDTRPSWRDHANSTGINAGFLDKLGGRVNLSQLRRGDTEHARHEIDENKKKAGLEGVDTAFLSGAQAEKLQKTYTKDNRSQIETEIRRGYDSKGEKIKNRDGDIIESESEFKAANRAQVISDIRNRRELGDVNARGQLTRQGEKKAEDKLRTAFGEKLNEMVKEVGSIRYEKTLGQSKEKVGIGERLMSRSTSGTYDVRNLANLKMDKREGLSMKTAAGIVSAIALGMRAGLKQTLNVETGKPQGDLFKDLGNTVTEALKGAKIKVDLGDAHGKGGAKHDNSAGVQH